MTLHTGINTGKEQNATSRKEVKSMYEVMQDQVTNGSRVIAEIQNAACMATMWEDEGGAYHDSGWNQSWPDGWRDSHG